MRKGKVDGILNTPLSRPPKIIVDMDTKTVLKVAAVIAPIVIEALLKKRK